MVLGFILKKLWLRLRGKFIRFGDAAVVYGTPLSLSETPQDMPMEELAHDLMMRIDVAMPMLGVPLLAQILLGGPAPMSRAALLDAATERMQAAPERFLLQPTEDVRAHADEALAHLVQRNQVTIDADDQVAVVPQEQKILQFYANAMPRVSAIAK